MDFSNIINQINNDVVKEVDSKPQEIDKEINNAEEVFKTEDVAERLDELRNSMTAASASRDSEGLSKNSTVVDVSFSPVNKTEEKKETSTTSRSWWESSKTSSSTTTKTKTAQEKASEFSNNILKEALKEIELEIKAEQQQKELKSGNWSIFDLHEEQLIHDSNPNNDKKEKKIKKHSKTKDILKLSTLEGLIYSGRSLIEMVGLASLNKNAEYQKEEKKTTKWF